MPAQQVTVYAGKECLPESYCEIYVHPHGLMVIWINQINQNKLCCFPRITTCDCILIICAFKPQKEEK